MPPKNLLLRQQVLDLLETSGGVKDEEVGAIVAINRLLNRTVNKGSNEAVRSFLREAAEEGVVGIWYGKIGVRLTIIEVRLLREGEAPTPLPKRAKKSLPGTTSVMQPQLVAAKTKAEPEKISIATLRRAIKELTLVDRMMLIGWIADESVGEVDAIRRIFG